MKTSFRQPKREPGSWLRVEDWLQGLWRVHFHGALDSLKVRKVRKRQGVAARIDLRSLPAPALNVAVSEAEIGALVVAVGGHVNPAEQRVGPLRGIAKV